MINKKRFIQYGRLDYTTLNLPKPDIEEVSFTFNNYDKQKNLSLNKYSLHTEPSIKKIDNITLERNFPTLNSSKYKERASLWTSDKWVDEFFEMIDDFIAKQRKKDKYCEVIEIHPPYRDQITLDDFFDRYCKFESKILNKYPEINILIENRNCCGDFLLSKAQDYVNFSRMINKNSLRLKLIIDIAQLVSKEIYINNRTLSIQIIDQIFNTLNLVDYTTIAGLHICGKSHKGNFSTIFNGNNNIKNFFLNQLNTFTNNLTNEIFIVPEIFSQKDFKDIINDLRIHNII